MIRVRIVGHKKNGQYAAHEVPPRRTAEIIEKLQEKPGVIRIESQLLLPPAPKFNNTKI